VPDLYDAADVYIMSRDLDNMPGLVLECLRRACRCIDERGRVPYILADGKPDCSPGAGIMKLWLHACFDCSRKNRWPSRLTATARRECDKYSAVRAGADC